jgi:hypothetical protein
MRPDNRPGAYRRIGGKIDISPVERAAELVLLDLAEPSAVLAPHGGRWRRASSVESSVRGRVAPFRHGAGEIETALDYLAARGLVATLYAEDEPRCPQQYRWSKVATRERLEAWARTVGGHQRLA